MNVIFVLYLVGVVVWFMLLTVSSVAESTHEFLRDVDDFARGKNTASEEDPPWSPIHAPHQIDNT